MDELLPAGGVRDAPVALAPGSPRTAGGFAPAPAVGVGRDEEIAGGQRRVRVESRWLMISSGVSAVLGMLFWVVAGNRYPQDQFGRDGAVITAMLGVSALGQLNLPLALLRLIPVLKRRRGAVLAAAMVATVGASVLAGGIALSLFHDQLSGFRAAGGRADIRLAFVVGAALWSTSVILDSIFVAFQHARWVPLKNISFGIAKIVLVYLLVGFVGGWGIFSSWLVATAAVVVPFGLVAIRLVRREKPSPGSALLAPKGRRAFAAMLGQDYLASVVGQAYALFVPALVLLTTGAVGSASFVVPFAATLAIDTLALSSVLALTAGAAQDETRVTALTRTAVRQVAPLVAGATAICLVGAPVLLLPFGVGGGTVSAELLRILVLASAARATLAIFEALCRIWGRTDLILVVQLAVGVPMLVLGWYAGRHVGVTAVAWCWVGVHAVAAVLMAPFVARLWRRQVVWERRGVA